MKEDLGVHEEHLGGQANHELQPVALTPRPIRLLIVGRIKQGAEPQLRETEAPLAALSGTTVKEHQLY